MHICWLGESLKFNGRLSEKWFAPTRQYPKQNFLQQTKDTVEIVYH